MRRKPVDSSAMRSAGYDETARVLEIEFPDRDVYRYLDVPPQVWRAFESAPSKGLFFSGELRDRFAFERVEKTRPGRSSKGARAGAGSGAGLPSPARRARSGAGR
ncbi:MAG TPA: KTSC domain-containing protein [Beijerinckiaceae bacterium]|jgi:hypothetical protein